MSGDILVTLRGSVATITYGPTFFKRLIRELGLGSSRREQRRARKARKNLVMYKTAGRRPWTRGTNVLDTPIIMAFLCSGRCPDWQCYCDVGDYVRTAHDNRLENLRERSGFIDMSRRATFLRYGVDFSRREHADFVGQGRRDD